MTHNLYEKFNEQTVSFINGNRTEWGEWLKTLNRADLVKYIIYLPQNTAGQITLEKIHDTLIN